MIQLLKFEAQIMRVVGKLIVGVTILLLPIAARKVTQSYVSLFILGLIGLSAVELYNPAASMNERSYVVFILLLSFLYTTKSLIVGFKQLQKWSASRTGTASQSPNFSLFQHGAFVARGLLFFVMVSMIPPIVIFEYQGIAWAKHFCIEGLAWSLLVIIAVAILSVHFSRFRDLIAALSRRIMSWFPLISSPTMAVDPYKEARARY